MEVTLDVLAGPDQGRTLHYDVRESVVLGRNGTPDRDLQLFTDPLLSREHLRLVLDGAAVLLETLPGKSPARVDGALAARMPLRDGALVQVGTSMLRVTLRAGAAALGAGGGRGVAHRRLSDFQLGPMLGEGGMGKVYEAVDRVSGKEVALKILHSAPGTSAGSREDAAAHFLREMEVLGAIEHESVVRTLALGRAGEDLFLAMERIHGMDLEAFVDFHGPLDVASVVEVARAILSALAHAHGLGFVHRDLKPSNVLVRREDGRLKAWLVDFGLAKSFADTRKPGLTETGMFKGTPDFSAPECIHDVKRAQPAADLFSLGATLYWALTQRMWFGPVAARADVFLAVVSRDIVPLLSLRPDVPREVAAGIERCLAREARERWPTAADLLAWLPDPPRTG